jgi:hypothetical protein
MSSPIQLRLHSRNPVAMVAAIRAALRRDHVDGRAIAEFTDEALTQGSLPKIRRYCETWADIVIMA